MKAFLLRLLGGSKLMEMLDGKKTMIGAVLVVISTLLQAAEHIVITIPQAAFLAPYLGQSFEVFNMVVKFLGDIGVTFLGVGLLHKTIKDK